MFPPPGTQTLVLWCWYGFSSFTWLYMQCTQVQAISCTLLLLYSCYIFGPLALLQNNRIGVRSTRVCPPWISPLQGLNPWPTVHTILYIGPSQTPLLLVIIGTVVLIETCMGSMPDSLQCVNILRHSTDANPQSRKRIFGWQAMCILIVLIPQ